MENHFGRTSELRLCFAEKGGRTVLEDIYVTAPFKIMKPFCQKDGGLTIMPLTASAGIMEGDCQEWDIVLKENTSASFVSQAYEKIHKMKDGKASRNIRISVGKNATLFFNPLPVIPFADSAFENRIEVDLADESSKLIFSDILGSGRISSDECFQYRLYGNRILIRKNNRLVFRENSRFEPAKTEMDEIGMYEGHTHLGTLLAFGFDLEDAVIQKTRQEIETTDLCAGITRLNSGDICVKALGFRGDDMVKKMRCILQMMQIPWNPVE
jgi:urease accessory protein